MNQEVTPENQRILVEIQALWILCFEYQFRVMKWYLRATRISYLKYSDFEYSSAGRARRPLQIQTLQMVVMITAFVSFCLRGYMIARCLKKEKNAICQNHTSNFPNTKSFPMFLHVRERRNATNEGVSSHKTCKSFTLQQK